MVVVEAVLVVPQPASAEGVHRVRNLDKVLEELGCQIIVELLVASQLERNREHAGAEEGHPGGPVRLLQKATRGQRLRAIENTYVVQAKKASREEVVALRVLAVHPPGEIE